MHTNRIMRDRSFPLRRPPMPRVVVASRFLARAVAGRGTPLCAGLHTAVALACACGGGDGPPATPPEPPAAGVASAAVSGVPAEVPADSAVTLTASALAAGGAAFSGATFTWSRAGTAAGELTVAGAGAAYRGTTPGADTITVTAAGGGRTATTQVVVTVRGPRVAAVAFVGAVAYVGVGATLALPAVGRTTGGVINPRAAIAYRIEAGTPAASVAADGTLTGLAIGTNRLIAAAPTTGPAGAWPADTLTVVVSGGAGDLSVSVDDTVLVAGRPLALTGLDPASGVSAQVDAAAAMVTPAPDGVVVVPPAALFASCQPLGRRVPVMLNAGGKARTLALGVYAPQRVALVPGQHAALTGAATAGCPVAVEQAGTYVVMPFAWDRQVAGPQATTASTPLRVSAGLDGHTFSARAESSSARAIRGVSPAPTTDVLRVSPLSPVRVAASPSAMAPACTTPTAVGATVPIGTLRDGTGRFRQAASVNGGGGASEPWTLAAVSPTAAVFFDSALVRAALPGATARAQAFAAAYDSTVAPLLAAVTEGVPDADGNGRVVVLVALRAGNALAYPAGYARPDCEAAGFTLGEAINLGGDAFVRADDLVAGAVSVAAHEAAHVVDNAQRYYQAPLSPAFRQDTWWSREGYAVLMQHLWALGAATPVDAFTGDRTAAARRTIEGTGVGGFCERPDRAVLRTWYALSGDAYPLACQAVRYALGQAALRSPGFTTRDLMVRWSLLRDRRRFADAVAGLGAEGSAADLTGAWYLSWAADGVAGAAPELRDPAADLRALTAAFFPGPYAPDQTTLAAGRAIDATLSEPDALHVRVELPAHGWVAVTDPTTRAGLPADRTGVLLVRVR